jgi:hypothetical protein
MNADPSNASAAPQRSQLVRISRANASLFLDLVTQCHKAPSGPSSTAGILAWTERIRRPKFFVTLCH